MIVIVNERAVNNSPPPQMTTPLTKMIYILPLSEEALYSGTEHSDLL